MDSISIGLWTTGGMLVMVVLGMRVAFAAGLAGFVGLIWLRWNGFDYDPAKFGKAVEVSAKVAGQVPHSKVSSQALSLIPTLGWKSTSPLMRKPTPSLLPTTESA